MIKILIDTNRFLDLYRTNKDSIQIFEEISKIRPHLICCEQGFNEFIRNRDGVITETINAIKKNQQNLYTTPLLKNIPEYGQLAEIQKQYNKIQKTLLEKVSELQKDPDKDPIFQQFLKLYNKKEISKYKITDKIIDKAHRRRLCGNPPGTAKKTICDEIIWETLLAYLDNSDLIIVSGDGTFIENQAYLEREFFNKKRKKLEIFDNIAEALARLGEIPSENIIEYDKEEVVRNFSRNKQLRFELIRRYQLLQKNQKPGCIHCGDTETNLELHHLIPLSQGGEDTIENLVLLCPKCHHDAHYPQ